MIIAGCVVIISFVGYQWYSAKASTQPASAMVRTAMVQKGTLEVKISGSGTIQPVTSEDIKSIITNDEIDEVLVKAGEQVNEGDVLITFTDGSDPITAPADGIITTLSVSAGERVTSGQVVAHLTNYNSLQTVVQIDELDISKIKKGQPVDLKVNAFSDQPYTGKVKAIADEGTSSNGVSTFDVTIQIDKPDNLKVGMSVEASILTVSKKNAIYVPLEAVHSAYGEKYVNLASNAGTEKQTVKTGIANEDYVEITDGVSAGETVQLPQLATGNASSNNKSSLMQGGFGSMGGVGRMNGMYRNRGNFGQSSGRSGN